MRTINLTPTWEQLMPALVAAAANGSREAMGELTRLAQIVDGINAKVTK